MWTISSGILLEEGGWTTAESAGDRRERGAYSPGARTGPCQAGRDLLHPEREPLSVLEELRRSMGSAEFNAQYQQEPVPLGGNLIQWSWFQFYRDPPGWLPSDRIVVSWDTAMSAKDLSDYSACVVLQVRGETVYVLDVIRERLEYPALKRRVIDVHRRWSNRGQRIRPFDREQGLRHEPDPGSEARPHPCRGVDPVADKVMRMNAQTARIEAGAVYLPQRAGWLDAFRSEVLAFPRGRYDDQVDALSQGLDRAFNFWRRRVSPDLSSGY